MFAARRLPGRDRRDGRRLDVLRRLAVPQLDRHRAATWTTCATRSCRSSTSATRPRPSRDHRGLTGKSSGGYGAMVVPMLRPDVFGALASHAGDALFECCYLPEFRDVARELRDHFEGSYEVFFERLALGRPLRLGRARNAARGLRLRGRVLARPRSGPARRCSRSTSRPAGCSTTCGRSGSTRTRCGWRRSTPTRCARCAASTSTPAARTSTSSTSAPQAFAAELERLGVDDTLELFDGKHGGLTYRYPGAIRELVLALT